MTRLIGIGSLVIAGLVGSLTSLSCCAEALSTFEILIQVFEETQGNRWKWSDGWNEEDFRDDPNAFCQWSGISCYSDLTDNSNKELQNEIVSINLSDNGLVGTLPQDIWDLPHLLKLDLRNNPDLTVEFSQIQNALKLEHLMISNTIIPSFNNLSKVKSLTELHITDCALEGNIPQEILKITTLQGLYSNFNNFKGPIPTEIGKLTALTELFLHENKLSGNLPSQISNLTNLQILALSLNSLSGQISDNIFSNMKSLEILALQQAPSDTKGGGFEGPLPTLAQLPMLTEVYLQNNNFNGPINPNFMFSAPKDETVTIDIRDNQLTGPIPQSLDSFQRLNIYLAGNKINDMPGEFCQKTYWMSGDVADNDCDAILCPIGQWSTTGRATQDESCRTCGESSLYFGATQCLDDPDSAILSALKSFYTDMGGNQWTRSDGWLNNADFCSWYGIICDDNSPHNIVQILLSDNRLSGTLNQDFYGHFNKLQALDLSNNFLQFNFYGIDQATELMYLNLESIGLNSWNDIGGLTSTKIRKLYLTSNRLKEPIPDILYDITTLVELTISHNSITGNIKQNIGNLGNLQKFHAYGNSLEGNIPTQFGNLKQLTELNLSENNFSGPIPTSFNYLHNLEYLAIHQVSKTVSDGLTGPLPSFIGCTSLQNIHLQYNSLSGPLPLNFLKNSNVLQKIINLDLNDNKLSGFIPNTWQRFSQLNVNLSNNKLAGIESPLCQMNRWQEGLVGEYGCDAILCERNYYNAYGRQTDYYNECDSCFLKTQYFGARTCMSDDRFENLEILTNFYFSTNGGNWENNDGWLDYVDYCEWFGIECANGDIYRIDLSNNGLIGTPATAIFEIEGLQELVLGHNQIYFDFTGIEIAEQLQLLHLSDTMIDTLEGIEKASSLKQLHLTENNLSGMIHNGLFELTNLEELYLNYNSFSGRIPAAIGNLKKMKEIYLVGNNLGGQIPASIGLLSDLEILILSDNNFVGTLPIELNNLRNLEVLAIQRGDVKTETEIRGSGISGPLLSFNKLPYLKEIYLGSNSLTGPIPYDFLDSLEDKETNLKVYLTGNFLSGRIPASLTQFENLNIHLAGNQFDDLAEGLCSMSNWLDGEVGEYGCDAILCKPGYYSALGRSADDNNLCKECGNDTNSEKFYYGSFDCAKPNTEREILEKLYLSLGGPDWSSKDGWVQRGLSICDWKGITCASKQNESVEAIHLSNNGLVGEVPVEIFDLPSLEEINLSGNDIKFHNKFEGIDKPENLLYLNLDSTGLKSLEGIQQASKLVLLHATDNDFHSFPSEVFSLNNLEVLYLSGNNFNMKLNDLTGLKELSDLIYFQCKDCGLDGEIPNWISTIGKLQYLSLSKNSLVGDLPQEIENLNDLIHLDLSDQLSRGGTGLTGNILSFSTNSVLSELYLYKNSFNGNIPNNILETTDTNLSVKIDLRRNDLDGDLPDFTRFKDLTLLLAGNRINTISEEIYCPDAEESRKDWNSGDLKKFGCDGLMCRPHSFNSIGRQSNGPYGPCEPCDVEGEAKFWGSTHCGLSDHQTFLKDFFISLDGGNWYQSHHWLEDDDICNWFGITCNDSKEVIKIDLENNGLSGSVPESIYNIQTLVSINLKENDIDFAFGGIKDLGSLDYLGLSETGVTTLAGIGQATSLTNLHLTNNNIKDIPDEFYNLINLEELYMNYNNIMGEISSKIGQLTKLKEFYLFNNKLEGKIPTELGLLQDLEFLILGRNLLTGQIPPEMNDLVNLKVLDLEGENGAKTLGLGYPLDRVEGTEKGVGLSGSLISFNNMPNLTELYLGSNSLDGPIPSDFLAGVSDKNGLIKVDLTLNDISGDLPLTLKEFNRMNLFLAGNAIDDIDESFCSLYNWMNGEVGINGCDSILCPKGTYNKYGRQLSNISPCMSCPFTYTAPNLGSISCAADTTDYSEREILSKIYESTGGITWVNKDNWVEDSVPICNWWGVHCASEDDDQAPEVVVQLKLASNNLEGTLPPQVFQLKNLKVLNIRDNDVDVDFLSIGEAISLEELYVDFTKISKLDGIGSAPQLEILRLEGNEFKGSLISEEIFSIDSLRELNIAESQFGGSLSTEIGNLSNLVNFFCHGNDLTGELPTEIGQMQNLEILVLSENRFIGTLPSEIMNLKNLETLFINSFTRNHAGLTGPLPSFQGMNKLRDIFLNSNSFTGTIPANFLNDLDNYELPIAIDLKSNRIEGNLPSELSRFSYLKIDIADNFITGIDEKLCRMSSWMSGSVDKFGCDAILCPAGTFNQYGRQSTEGAPCIPCQGSGESVKLGSTMCELEVKKEERLILEALYIACGGDNWKKKFGWLDPDIDICHWYGISCRDGGILDSILLGSNNLVGTPPRSIFKLRNLKWLWLYSNPMDFKFDGIGDATQLTSLLLDSTGLKSLDGIGDASQLTDLDLRFNKIEGPIPTELSNLINIEKLSLNDNKFTGSIPSFSRLKNLKSLRMGGNMLQGTLPDFATHTKLNTLDFSENRLSGPIPPTLLNNVHYDETIFIDLSSNTLVGDIPAALSRFDRMTLLLRDNLITGVGTGLCDKKNWNDGDVSTYECDGILCPPGSYASGTGRASKKGNECIDCEFTKYYGQSTCEPSKSSATSLNFASMTAILVAVVTFLMF